jgi:hypothetical protein
MNSRLIGNMRRREKKLPLIRPLLLREVIENRRLSHHQESRQNHPQLKEKELKGNYSLVKRVSKPRTLLKEITL